MLVRGSIALVCVLGVSTTGCLVASHSSSDPVRLDDFCDRFFDALCEPLESCGCGPAAGLECRSEQRAICTGFPSVALEAAVADGSVRYDAGAASGILTRLAERGCGGFVPALGWQVRDLFDLGGIFIGRGGAGESCVPLGFELISACRLGSCMPSPGGNVCRVSAEEGETCDRTHQCVDLDRYLDVGGTVERLTLRCDPRTPGDEVGTCRRWAEIGGTCEVATDCWTGSCVAGICGAATLGTACLSTRECADGLYCDSSVCVAGGAADGAACTAAAACASKVCVGGVCLPAGCGTF